jgi:hypothetical protein
MKTIAIIVAASVGAVSDPPILPFTEISDEKIQTLAKHMQDADEITVQDCNVVLQLEHIRWKYQMMREALYFTARKAEDGATIEAKHLGKIFDRIDAQLDEDREKILQEARKEDLKAEQEKIKGKDA